MLDFEEISIVFGLNVVLDKFRNLKGLLASSFRDSSQFLPEPLTAIQQIRRTAADFLDFVIIWKRRKLSNICIFQDPLQA